MSRRSVFPDPIYVAAGRGYHLPGDSACSATYTPWWAAITRRPDTPEDSSERAIPDPELGVVLSSVETTGVGTDPAASPRSAA